MVSSRPVPVLVLFAATAAASAASAQALPTVAVADDPEPGSKEFAAYQETVPEVRAVKSDLAPIAGGSFLMGSPASEADRNADEGPQVEVRVRPFWIGRCEVTWDEYDCWNTDASLFTDAPFVGFRVVRPLHEPEAAERARYENPR